MAQLVARNAMAGVRAQICVVNERIHWISQNTSLYFAPVVINMRIRVCYSEMRLRYHISLCRVMT